MKKNEKSRTGAGYPDQDLVMAGYMALAGTDILIERESPRLRTRLPEELLQEAQKQYRRLRDCSEKCREKLDFPGCGLSAQYPLGEGGILNALWDMAHQWDIGFTVQLKTLPVRQETIEICEILEINPYYLKSDDCLLLAADHGNRLCERLRERGMAAAVIGVLNDTNDRILVHDDTVSYLNRPREDELERFFKEEKQRRL